VVCISQSRDQVPAITVMCLQPQVNTLTDYRYSTDAADRISLFLSWNKTFYFSCSYTAATYNEDIFLHFPSRGISEEKFLKTHTTALSHTGNELDLYSQRRAQRLWGQIGEVTMLFERRGTEKRNGKLF
jgi:hypothetical protein